MSILDLDALDATPLSRDPFDHVVVPRFIRPEWLDAVNQDFPPIEDPGTYPVEGLSMGPAFEAFWKEVQGAELRRAIERRFGVDLSDHPLMATVRDQCQSTDGAIHTDSKTKVITCLFYFEPTWTAEGGRLRLLRSATDLEDYAAEVLPCGGTFLAFRRCGHSYHGHKPFAGRRRIMQIHWVDPKRIERNERKRRSLPWRIKKALRLG
jgi:SM-20-related protein